MRFSSRKFLLAVFTIGVVILNDRIGLTPQGIQALVYTTIAFITAEGIKDISVARINAQKKLEITGTPAD